MTSDTVERRLSAIVSADVVGYTSLMSEDRLATIEGIKRLRSDIDRIAQQHRGRVVDNPGDNFLLAFPSATDAVEAAIEIQALLSGEAGSSTLGRMQLRIGIHLGEVIADEDRIYGDGVNIAARLEAMAAPGGICISKTVRDQVSGGLQLVDLGEKPLKNVPDPIHAFTIVLSDDSVPSTNESEIAEDPNAAWIAVLPFSNLGGDPEQDYFADGITEDVITGLSAFRTLRVISRTSTFRYRDSDLPVPSIAEELGVRFVLEGSVRRSGSRIRVGARLIEAPDRHHLWADRYDAEVDDVFEVQDRIAESIVVAIDPAIHISEASRVSKKRPESMSVWDHIQRGRAEMSKGKREANLAARAHFMRAIEQDPQYAGGHSGAAWTYFWDAFLEWSSDSASALEEGYRFAKRAIELDELDAAAYAVLGGINMWMGRLDASQSAAERAIDLNPSLASGYVVAAAAVKYAGDPRRGVELFTRAIELSPHDPSVHWFYGGRALGYFMLGEYETAITDARTAVRSRYGYILARIVLIASLVEVGLPEQAREELSLMLSIHPSVGSDVLSNYPFTTATEADRDRLIAGLEEAGLES